MNNTTKLIVGILLVLPLLFATPIHAQDQCEQLVGTWEYQLDEDEGMWMATKTHIMWVITNKDRQPFENKPPTEAERAEAYSTLSAVVGSYTCKGNAVMQTYLYSKNPNLKGRSFKWEYEVEGNTIKWWTLDAEGERGDEGRARRVKK